MTLVDAQVARLLGQVGELTATGAARQLSAEPQWPRGRSLILARDVAVELGNPATGAIGALLWTDRPLPARGVRLLGPDLEQLEGQVALGQLVVASGRFDDEAERLLDLQDALDAPALSGVTSRTMPSEHRAWYRVSREAWSRGLSLSHLGEALVAELEGLDFVDAALVVFVTGAREALVPFRPVADEAARITGALIKRRDEPEHECEVCDFSDVCVEALL